ncbi:DUF1428 domain-containing protein [Sphingomonas sp. Mn802worker]|uniref:DUF1428 domain-containing protein n=1 Tax=Sphingomonas sp. Mn802worker TaxID=629773 RepID=UPI0003794B1C|nr:DUF1428 domain-containing protein [Sphingomonas sp. Mn802worker]
MTYVNGFVTPVPGDGRDAYVAAAAEAWPLFAEYGALQMIENWGDKVPAGERTDFARAVSLREGEAVVFSWVLWPDRDTAERCEAAMHSDERFQTLSMPFDGTRMIFGGFETVFHAGAGVTSG